LEVSNYYYYYLQPIYNHDRIYPITQDLHNATWVYFTLFLPGRFNRSPTVVKEAIMADINDLVQDFWRTSSDGADGGLYLAMRRLLGILQECFHIFKVCFDIISVFATAVDLADKCLKRLADPIERSLYYPDHLELEPEVRAKFKILFNGYRKMFDQSFSLVGQTILRR
jgi:hypothetical protein